MATSQEEIELIRAVVADPDDDAPRLAYAKWLIQHGQPDRAQLIHVQCEAEKLHARERELLAAHAQEWGMPLFAIGADSWKFHRGFPEEMQFTLFADFLKHQEKIAELTPIRHLNVMFGDDHQVEQLVQLPALKHLRSLELGSPYLNDNGVPHFGIDGVSAVANSPQLAKLQSLTLHSCDIGANGAKLIAASHNLHNLTHLWLHDPVFDPRRSHAYADLVLAPTLANLERLQMGDKTDLGANAIQLVRDSTPTRHR